MMMIQISDYTYFDHLRWNTRLCRLEIGWNLRDGPVEPWLVYVAPRIIIKVVENGRNMNVVCQ
jgi:hypothetical protein